MRLKAILLAALAALSLAACQTAPPAPTAAAKPVTYGEWTVKTSGYVRAEAAIVR